MKKWKNSKKYKELYLELGGIYGSQETISDSEGFRIERCIQKETVEKMVGVFKREQIDDVEEMLMFIMQMSKGHENPKIVIQLLEKILNDK